VIWAVCGRVALSLETESSKDVTTSVENRSVGTGHAEPEETKSRAKSDVETEDCVDPYNVDEIFHLYKGMVCQSLWILMHLYVPLNCQFVFTRIYF
jgi:hypothetical protein